MQRPGVEGGVGGGGVHQCTCMGYIQPFVYIGICHGKGYVFFVFLSLEWGISFAPFAIVFPV